MDEVLAQGFVGLAAHCVLVEKGIDDVADVLLGDSALASEQVIEQFTHLEDFVMKIGRDHFRESQHELVQKFKECQLARFVCLEQYETLHVLKNNLQELKHFLTRTARLTKVVNSLKHRQQDTQAVCLNL